jgi:hypothetical protein
VWQQRRNLLERGVYPVSPALFGDLVRRALGGEIGRELAWVGNAGDGVAFEDALVVGLGGQKVGGGFFSVDATGEERFDVGGNLGTEGGGDLDGGDAAAFFAAPRHENGCFLGAGPRAGEELWALVGGGCHGGFCEHRRW